MNNGYIKIHRKILEWEWYKEPITSRVFIHCLFKANWKDNKFQGYAVPRGSFITSIKTLSEELSGKKKEDKVSIRNIRTALNHLKSTNDITIKTTSKFSIITINKYDEYQCDDNVSDNQPTNNRQTTDTQVTTNEEKKESNKEQEYKKESISKDIRKKYFENLKVDTIFYEFLEIRKKIKAVNSEIAIQKLVNKLNKYDDETKYKMIENSVINSWKDVYPLKQEKQKKGNVLDTLKDLYNEENGNN